jgi:hypothetical protein
MATGTQYGANYTVAKNVTPSTVLAGAKWQGRVCHIHDEITMSQVCDSGSILYIGTLPKGAIAIAVNLSCDTTNAVTGTIGYTGDTDALGTFTTLAASNVAGGKWSIPTVGNTPLTGEKDIYITTAGAGLESASVLKTDILYSPVG